VCNAVALRCNAVHSAATLLHPLFLRTRAAAIWRNAVTSGCNAVTQGNAVSVIDRLIPDSAPDHTGS